MDVVYGLGEVAEVEAARAGALLALQADGEPLPVVVGSTLIEVVGDGQPERQLWNVIMALVRHFRAVDSEPELLGLEGRDGPQGLELLNHLDALCHQRLEDEHGDHRPIVAIFPPVDGLPEDHASTFQTLVMKSGRVNMHVVTTASEPGLLPMFFAAHIRTDDPNGLTGTLVGKHEDPDVAFVTPYIKRQDINHFKKSLG